MPSANDSVYSTEHQPPAPELVDVDSEDLDSSEKSESGFLTAGNDSDPEGNQDNDTPTQNPCRKAAPQKFGLLASCFSHKLLPVKRSC